MLLTPLALVVRSRSSSRATAPDKDKLLRIGIQLPVAHQLTVRETRAEMAEGETVGLATFKI